MKAQIEQFLGMLPNQNLLAKIDFMMYTAKSGNVLRSKVYVSSEV